MYCLLILKVIAYGVLQTVSVAIGNLNSGKEEGDLLGSRYVEIFDDDLPGSTSENVKLLLPATILYKRELGNNISCFLLRAKNLIVKFDSKPSQLKDFPSVEVNEEIVPVVNCAGFVMRNADLVLCESKREQLKTAKNKVEREEGYYFGNFSKLTNTAVFHVKDYDDALEGDKCTKLDELLTQLKSLSGRVMNQKNYTTGNVVSSYSKKYFSFTEHVRIVTMEEYMEELRVYGMSPYELAAYDDLQGRIARRAEAVKVKFEQIEKDF